MKEGYIGKAYVNYVLTCWNNQREKIYGPVIFMNSSTDPTIVAQGLYDDLFLNHFTPEARSACRYFSVGVHPFVMVLDGDVQEILSKDISLILVEKIKKWRKDHFQNLALKE